MPRRRAAWSSWNVDQASCRPAGDRGDDDLPHEPAPGAARPDRLVRVGQPGRPLVRDDRVILARSFSHPRYTPRSLEAQAAIGTLQGHRATWYAGAHLGWGFHEDGCRSGYAVADAIGERPGGGGRMRSHLLEGTVRHRRARPVGLRPGARRLLPGPRPRRARPRRPAATAARPEPAQRPGVPRRATTGRSPRRTCGRPSTTTCAPTGEDPTGWRITLVTNPRTFGLRLQPGVASTCAAMRAGDLRVVVVEVHNTHLERHLYTLRPSTRR